MYRRRLPGGQEVGVVERERGDHPGQQGAGDRDHDHDQPTDRERVATQAGPDAPPAGHRHPGRGSVHCDQFDGAHSAAPPTRTLGSITLYSRSTSRLMMMYADAVTSATPWIIG